MEFPCLNGLLLCSFSGSKSIDGTKFNFLIRISFVYFFNKLRCIRPNFISNLFARDGE